MGGLKKITNGMYRSSFGIGELILKLRKLGIRKFIIGFGGSTVSDFGIGLAHALGIKFYNNKYKPISLKFEKLDAFSLKKIKYIDTDNFFLKDNNLEFSLLSDSKVKLTGKEGQVSVFAKQKGILGQDKVTLSRGFENLKNVLEKKFKKKLNKIYMGAGGGTLAMIYCLFNSKIYPGDKYVQDMVNLEDKIFKSDIIISGEGILDKSSKTKGIWSLIKKSKKFKKKIILITGISRLNFNNGKLKVLELFKKNNSSISKKIIISKLKHLSKNIKLDKV